VSGPGDQVAPSWSPNGKQIAYVNGDFGSSTPTSSIWIVAPDGSGKQQLTNAGGVSNDPVWSPSGSEIAFESNRNEDYDVYVMFADGSSVRNVTNFPSLDASPAWAPDGSKIAFVSDRSGKGHREIYVMPAQGGKVVRVTHSPANVWATQPDWQRVK